MSKNGEQARIAELEDRFTELEKALDTMGKYLDESKAHNASLRSLLPVGLVEDAERVGIQQTLGTLQDKLNRAVTRCNRLAHVSQDNLQLRADRIQAEEKRDMANKRWRSNLEKLKASRQQLALGIELWELADEYD